MRLKDLKIATQLRLGLGIILFFVFLLGALAWWQSDILWLQTKNIYEHPFKVRSALGALQTDLMGMRLEQRNAMQAQDEQGRQTAVKNSDVYQADAEIRFKILHEAYLGPGSDLDDAHRAFVRWVSLLVGNRDLKRSATAVVATGRTGDAAGTGVELEELLGHIEKIDVFAKTKSENFYLNAGHLHGTLDLQLGACVAIIFILSSAIGLLM